MKYITRKSLLYKTKVEYGDYTINHILGCAHGCCFPCYAFNMAKRFGNVKTYENWIEPKLVSNSIEILNEELPKIKNKIKSVNLCFTTDPFMDAYPEVGLMSIKIINRLNEDNIKCVILTKGLLPKKLCKTSKINEYGITLVSLNDKFKEKYEPFGSDYNKRVEHLKFLHDKGFKTWISIEPYPTPNILKQDIFKILRKVKFVDKIVFGRLHYNAMVTKYKNYKNFYNLNAAIVMDFCLENNINCHIKKGTIDLSCYSDCDSETKEVFSDNVLLNNEQNEYPRIIQYIYLKEGYKRQ